MGRPFYSFGIGDFYPDGADAFKKALDRKHFFSNDRLWPMDDSRGSTQTGH